jgi:pimeloyl-ACP methyl ester carboxylesterase
LADRYRVVALDRRGFGETTYEPESHDSAADVVAVLDVLGVERAAVVGNSVGGKVAIEVALASPARVVALVLIGTAVRGAPVPERLPDDVEALFDRLDEIGESGDVDGVNQLEARIWLDGPSRAEGAVSGAVRELFLDMNGRALTAIPPGDEIRPDGPPIWDRLEQISVPVLATAGGHDVPHIVERSRTIAARVPAGRYLELPDSAHLPMLDDPHRFNEALNVFLAEHAS